MKDIAKLIHFFTILCLTFFPKVVISLTLGSLNATQSLTNEQTLVSPGQVFELGFFDPGNSKWYLGIWYKKIPVKTIVWVANKDNPLSNSSSGTFKISDRGNIVVVDSVGSVLWSSKQTQEVVNPVVQLLDSGNLVVRETSEIDPEKHLWQSFDYPTDTLLPDMKMGLNFDSGFDWNLTSWKSSEDPSTGDYSFKLDVHGFPEIFLLKNQEPKYRSGPWNGIRFSGVPEMAPLNGLKFSFVMDEHEVTYSFSITNAFLISRLIMNSTGYLQRFTWIESSQEWNLYWEAPKDQCDNYKECGPYGICDTNASPVCRCMKGFSPKNLQAWNLRDGSEGCVRNTTLGCRSDRFLQLKNMKLPETTTAFVDKTMSLKDCEEMCLKNCSCTAYANYRINDGGIGCVTWTSELVDMRAYTEGSGQDLYVRLAASEIAYSGSADSGHGSDKTKQIIMVIGITVSIVILLSGLTVFFVRKRKGLQMIWKEKTERRKGPRERSQDLLLNEVVISSKKEYSSESNIDDLELPLFDFSTLAMATNNFSDENKLGQGGFGSVYKGRLVEDHEIAVKRLSKSSGQGIEEFKNEVRLIARLQHRNLVRLLGCCVDIDEKILIYEYMENKSLDYVLFDKAKRSLLDWPRRFNIICGTARGLLYLHQDSRFRIIHRDLKASNILLDGEMNPKISDFGMARIFGKDQTEANTRRVVGTYGYMSPEYAMDGHFSVKSDVFSFGVLVLEIISGKKNRGFYYANNELNLLGHVSEENIASI
ncbi:hypothetical protein I3843_10G107900 [Carya illinoinensis]|uniref:Receptor-like serine/threonine-protein kinase n=1 Tax=Carya illinoinensis TaxID=32201 RepID=A0A922J3S7_CARIL|nr:hypothetical protein I3760_10G112300 [Carya illinoinensis]KAG6692422.1 hypothetical protein I3842_10G113700 [Carya illinoinensis]KAG7960145.1 hypothetical protein I3843_10G107900 [Carya illinoinensis]